MVFILYCFCFVGGLQYYFYGDVSQIVLAGGGLALIFTGLQLNGR